MTIQNIKWVDHCFSLASLALFITLAFVAALPALAFASGISGTLSNFDIYNTTTEPVEGAEIELEDCHSSDVGGHYPSHFAIIEKVDYNENGKTGVRIRFKEYNFHLAPTPGSLLPNPNPVSTNGHQLTNTAGGEHFGFWLKGKQPTATRFYWLNEVNGTYTRVSDIPEIVPGPTWRYNPPANPGDRPVVGAEIHIPEPAEIIQQKPDSAWVKVYKVKLPADYLPQNPDEMQALLLKLISDANPENDQPDLPPGDIVPEGDNPVEIESEWELLEGGIAPKPKVAEDPLEDNDKVIIRRYEFYKYTGQYDVEHEPITLFLDPGDLLEPPAGELGPFISANMVAAVLDPADLPSPIDFNGDGLADLADLAIFTENWLQRGRALLGDLNDDKVVNIEDLFEFSAAWP